MKQQGPRRRWVPPKRRILSEDYYSSMISIEKSRLEMQQRESNIRCEYYNIKKEYYKRMVMNETAIEHPPSLITLRPSASNMFQSPTYIEPYLDTY